MSGGLSFVLNNPPESDALHFVRRIRIPTLMINGRDDFIFPVDQLQLPMFRLLGAAAGDKRHLLVDGGHDMPRNLIIKETLAWLDRYLGPVRGAP
jgi:pimeloyl-ACP methyl ester carboxylesterase